jgi:16S rRNA (guanine527-N7)-methyltransferase
VAFREKLARRAKKAGISVSTEVISGLEAYFDLLQKWNRKVSLTSLPVETLGDEAIDRLLIEPLVASKYVGRAASVIDIGTGGGSPAIPMKVASPEIAMRMVESKTRKAAFLREVVRQLGLTRTHVEGSRFEALLARPELHESADVVTMRAVRAERKTLMGLQAFLKPGGFLFVFGTGSGDEEPALVNHLGLSLQASHSLVASLHSRLAVFLKTGGP